jgi:hypothetical protein
METTQSGINLFIDTPLKARINRASQSVPRRLQWRLYLAGLVIMDILMIGLANRLAYFLRFESSIAIFNPIPVPDFGYYRLLILFITPAWLLIFLALGLYDRQKLLGGTKEYSLVFNASTIGIVLIIAFGFLDPTFIIARGWLLLAWILSFIMTAAGRFALRRIVYTLRYRGYFLASAVIIGANNEGLSLAEQLMGWKSSGFHIMGFIDKKLPTGTHLMRGLHVLGTVEDLDELIEKFKIEEIILASSAISSRDKVLEIFQRYGISSDVNVRMSSGLYEIITTGLTVKEFAYVPLVGVNKVRLTGLDESFKFILDFLLTIPGLILISPILLAIAIAIKIDSPGAVLHRRRVLGIHGHEFDAFKFRTMCENGDHILAGRP